MGVGRVKMGLSEGEEGGVGRASGFSKTDGCNLKRNDTLLASRMGPICLGQPDGAAPDRPLLLPGPGEGGGPPRPHLGRRPHHRVRPERPRHPHLRGVHRVQGGQGQPEQAPPLPLADAAPWAADWLLAGVRVRRGPRAGLLRRHPHGHRLGLRPGVQRPPRQACVSGLSQHWRLPPSQLSGPSLHVSRAGSGIDTLVAVQSWALWVFFNFFNNKK